MIEQLPDLPIGYEFHHIGYATGSLNAEREFLVFLGYSQEGEIFVDPIQGITGCFMAGPGPRIELLENLPGRTVLTPWLNAGIKMYHLAYLVESSLEDALKSAQSYRAKITVSPIAAVAFGGRHISFVTFRNGLMIELIEKPLSA